MNDIGSETRQCPRRRESHHNRKLERPDEVHHFSFQASYSQISRDNTWSCTSISLRKKTKCSRKIKELWKLKNNIGFDKKRKWIISHRQDRKILERYFCCHLFYTLYDGILLVKEFSWVLFGGANSSTTTCSCILYLIFYLSLSLSLTCTCLFRYSPRISFILGFRTMYSCRIVDEQFSLLYFSLRCTLLPHVAKNSRASIMVLFTFSTHIKLNKTIKQNFFCSLNWAKYCVYMCEKNFFFFYEKILSQDKGGFYWVALEV